MSRLFYLVWMPASLVAATALAEEPSLYVECSGGLGELRAAIDSARPGATIRCVSGEEVTADAPVLVEKAITLIGLKAKLQAGLGNTPLIIVGAENVSLRGLSLSGNYDSVDQSVRAPLVRILVGSFRLEDCKFFDGSKDGVEVRPAEGGEDVVGGVIRNVEAFRMGRDAVSLSGGSKGARVRNVTVEDVSLRRGYLRGAVEISDGTDNIRVRRVYAEDCRYAIDVQDHGSTSAPNTNISIEDVTAVNCRHLLRTANSPRGHRGLSLSNVKSTNCEKPIRISNTSNVTINALLIADHKSSKWPPVLLKRCHKVRISNANIETSYSMGEPLQLQECTDVTTRFLTTAVVTPARVSQGPRDGS